MSSCTSDHDARSSERSFEHTEVYRYGPLYRWGAYVTAGIAVLSGLAISGTAVLEGLSEMNWVAHAGVAAGLAGSCAAIPSLLSELHLTENRLRKEWPLRANREVYFDEVDRVFVGGASVELYVASGTDPALTFDRTIRGGDELIEKLVRRLPASAEVDHPSGELQERLGERLTGA